MANKHFHESLKWFILNIKFLSTQSPTKISKKEKKKKSKFKEFAFKSLIIHALEYSGPQ